MAYRFNGSSNYVEFSPAPLVGWSDVEITEAILVKRARTASVEYLTQLVTAGGGAILNWFIMNNDHLRLFDGATSESTGTVGSTTPWYLLAVTRASGVSPRHHIWNGSSWSHGTVAGSSTPNTIGGTDRLFVGDDSTNAAPISADIVCAGIRKTTATDLQIEALNVTAFSSWQSFGFDWLIGFDTSLKSGGVLQDQSAAGTGDQVGINGTSVVSDPPGWTWGGGGGGGGPAPLLAQAARVSYT